MTEETNINWYDQHASDYCDKAIHEDMSWPYADFLAHLAENPAKILDLGCGSGRDLLYFKNKGHAVEGLDGSKEMCNAAQKLIKAEVLHQKFSQLDLGPNKYDGVFANATLMHVEPQDRLNFLNQIFDSLRKNGIFYAHYPKGSGTQQSLDGRTLRLTENWLKLCNNFAWTLELTQGRPIFFTPEEQTWQAIRFRKN
ncbi:class I SAM-dependent methyltransferase [Lentisphaera marina]|uniref:class I SAM-dependent methyltransferase n=1 Tax=Lentisphaera marina TaxID=1111041 RepID=UPI002365E847|nr:class I SAM-dependent methyltransferase [Lentisphaera marina]MDD7984113.1 class I SAM-dependent methyltransferase [Lentisphaera marina]